MFASLVLGVTSAWSQQVSTGSGRTYSVWVSNTGNVGIGTQDPTTALDVSGSMNVSGTVRLSGTGSETCDAAHVNTLRFDPTNGLQVCTP